MGRTRLYRNGELVDRDFPAADVAGHLQDPSAIVWFDLCAPAQDETGPPRDELGLHEPAIEDAVVAVPTALRSVLPPVRHVQAPRLVVMK